MNNLIYILLFVIAVGVILYFSRKTRPLVESTVQKIEDSASKEFEKIQNKVDDELTISKKKDEDK